MSTDIIQKYSPNFEPRKPGFDQPSMLVIHYTDCLTVQEAFDILCDPDRKASAHYLISETGELYQLVDESMRAWHAGVSYWRGCTDINSASIGIELANPGHRYGCTPFPQVQMDRLILLAKDIMSRYAIAPNQVVAHSDIAPLRRMDPGEFFDWSQLANAGIGLMPQGGPGVSGDRDTLLATLITIGYNPADIQEAPDKVIEAFCRHYSPSHFTTPTPLSQLLALAQEIVKMI